jgi:DUF971 family protein
VQIDGRGEPADGETATGPEGLTTVTDITVDRTRAVTLVYADGTTCQFPLDKLRAACPCAACRGVRERGEVAWPRPGMSPEITIVDAELTGAWGLSLVWSDGHDTGIYAWRNLRRWWDDGLPASFTIDTPAR